MPELPEVQTVVSDLNKKIKGDVIVDFWSDWKKAIKSSGLEKFKKDIIGRKVIGARRIGKNIFIDLSGGKTLYIHLKMTGHLLVKTQANFQFPTLSAGRQVSNFQSISNDKISKNQKPKTKNYFDDRVNQYIHHIWYLKSKSYKLEAKSSFDKALEFSDLRKFGKIVLVDTDKISELPEIEALGIDAMDPNFDLKKFQEVLSRKKNAPIGILLMDQGLISGIGNIYRSEILFEAGILPKRKAGDINLSEQKKLYSSIKKVLEKAIRLRGTSDSDYRDTDGAPGGFQKVLSVYNKKGEECRKCGKIIIRGKMGQRSVFSCPNCQK